ncbi:MAG: hypothetical protein KF699_15800 [Phycisphaeraceae bacterium]|nr:hypothetical protein [Phycisphaeraceae bacterium]MBX3406979.1 hypothetical protein [Phycisphaeraceae bacterium]
MPPPHPPTSQRTDDPAAPHAAAADYGSRHATHFQPVAGVLALLMPGLGHWFLGYRRRGVYIAVGVLAMFATGLLVGGIDAVDRREDFPWFLGQALVGPVAVGVDWVHQSRFKVRDVQGLRSAYPNEYRNPRNGEPVITTLDPADGLPMARLPSPGGDPLTAQVVKPAWPPNVKSMSRMNELGMLFGTIAGMMNLICVIDASFSRRRREGDPA